MPVKVRTEIQETEDTCLSHWGWLKRLIHRRCRESVDFNNIVAAIEMRLGQEEVLSLPQYMGLCPTGQCNALCTFCSVTQNRTGITKKQLPIDKLNRFIDITKNTVRLYGIEGNGEPTLYSDFDGLVDRVTVSGAYFYLITNGERLTEHQIDHMVAAGLESINFSLNACDSETHHQVMKLKNFDGIVGAIKRAVAAGRPLGRPTVSASFVVVHQNIHQLVDFMKFAAWDLQVDKVYIRPLSELGTRLGAVEDLRDIVPYEADVTDMLEDVAEFMVEYYPEGVRCPIIIDPAAFQSVRPNPRDGTIPRPQPYPHRLLPPRRSGWSVTAGLSMSWQNPSVWLRGAISTAWSFVSISIPVEPGEHLDFKAKLTGQAKPVRVQVVAATGVVLAEQEICLQVGIITPLALKFNVPDNVMELFIRMEGDDGNIDIAIDFERLRTPSGRPGTEFILPSSKQWMPQVEGLIFSWCDEKGKEVFSRDGGVSVRMDWAGASGPYLLRTYAIPCKPDSEIRLTQKVIVERGRLSIGILNQALDKWVTNKIFDSGFDGMGELIFNTGDSHAVSLVLSATASPVTACVDWGGKIARKEEVVIHDPRADRITPKEWPLPSWLSLPPQEGWTYNPAMVSAKWEGNTVFLHFSGSSTASYQSSPIPCDRSALLYLPLRVAVTRGRITVVIRSASTYWWLASVQLEAGDHDILLEVLTRDNNAIEVSILGEGGGASEVSIDFDRIVHRHGELPPLHTFVPRMPLYPRPIDYGMPPVPKRQARRHRGLTAAAILVLAVAAWVNRNSDRRIYCQKPWTDLNNFTVDGRMDVCCIATGASQEEYALGNIFTDSFQQVWNGQVMREFRRTVNDKAKLHPCQRCPMSFAYQGLPWSPSITMKAVEYRINYYFQDWQRRISSAKPLLEKLHAATRSAADRFLSDVIFARFRLDK